MFKKVLSLCLAVLMVAALGVSMVSCGKDKSDFKLGVICLHDEDIDTTSPLEIFDPEYTWKRRVMEDYTANLLTVPIFVNGKQVYELPSLDEIRDRCHASLNSIWPEVLRFENPHNYYVDLSEKLWTLKNNMINNRRNG